MGFEINLLSGHISPRPRRQTEKLSKTVVDNIGEASEEAAGLLSPEDKAKLNNMEAAMQSVTWADLVALRDEGKLTPGAFYRITDYVTTTTQIETQSAGHAFDIIVRADSENVLNENAFAVQHEGDTYFAQSKLAAWQLKYSLDNDTTKFLWADPEAGKGVVYYLKDEFNNECPFDFKNIRFKRYRCIDVKDNTALEPVYIDNYYCWQTDGDVLIEDDTDFVWYYTFAIKDNPDVDFSLNKERLGVSFYNSDLCACSDNIMLKHIVTVSLDDETFLAQQSLNNIVLLSFNPQENGYINIIHNYFGSRNHDITIFNGCESVRTGERCFDITGDVSFGVFGDKCHSMVFGTMCYSNTFGNGCYSNMFGSSCSSNTFGNDCDNNTFGNGYEGNTFGSSCFYNTFGNDCEGNTFGHGCCSNTFGSACCFNTFGSACSSNTFGSACSYNHYDNYVQSVKVSLNCFTNNTIKGNVSFIQISCEDIGSAAIQNILIYSDIIGTVGNPVNIEIPARNGSLLEIKPAAATTLEI